MSLSTKYFQFSLLTRCHFIYSKKNQVQIWYFFLTLKKSVYKRREARSMNKSFLKFTPSCLLSCALLNKLNSEYPKLFFELFVCFCTIKNMPHAFVLFVKQAGFLVLYYFTQSPVTLNVYRYQCCGSGSFYHQEKNKNSKKNLDSYCFVTLKNDVKCTFEK